VPLRRLLCLVVNDLWEGELFGSLFSWSLQLKASKILPGEGARRERLCIWMK
jgi:hypothetical protein